MPFKDREKQKQANKEWARRKRQGTTSAGTTSQGTMPDLPPDDELFAGLPDALRIYANGEQGGTWYRQMIHHLKTTFIEQLQAEGLPFIPGWRYLMETKSGAAPIAAILVGD